MPLFWYNFVLIGVSVSLFYGATLSNPIELCMLLFYVFIFLWCNYVEHLSYEVQLYMVMLQLFVSFVVLIVH